ncbi:MAG: hypothetical protein AB1668_02605 [Nanoarchaeota archaeon]
MNTKRQLTGKRTFKAGASKPAVIAVIAVLAVLALSLLVFFSGKFVGKAIQPTQINEGNVGIFVSGSEVEGKEFEVPIMVYLPPDKQSSVISFELSYDKDVLKPDCDTLDVALDDKYGYYRVIDQIKQCDKGLVSFEYAFLPPDIDTVIKDKQVVGTILFTGLKPTDSTVLSFNKFNVYDLATGELMEELDIKDTATITITAKKEKVCSAGETLCNNQCVNTKTDAKNCGSCGNVCPIATPLCAGGKCTAQATCNDNIKNQDETDVDCGSSCPSKCAVGKSCNAGSDCSSGKCTNNVCEAVCAPGLTLCNGQCVNLQTDKDNCGSCGTVCSNGQVCSNGACTLSCSPGQTLCANTCVDLKTDESNCGSCGTVCPKDNECTESKCVAMVKKEGKLVTLFEITPVDDKFSTKITATTDITDDIEIYTVLYDQNDRTLSVKFEKKVQGLKQGESYVAVNNYGKSNVKKKSVIVFDKEGADQKVYGTLEVSYS